MSKIGLYVSVTLLVSFLTLVGAVCFVISKVQKQVTSPLELSLTHLCKTKKLQSNSDVTGEPLRNESNDCSLMIKTSPSSGFSNFRGTGGHISTSSPTDTLSTGGLPLAGIKSLTADVLNTPKLEQVLKPLEQEKGVFLNTPLNTAQNESRKPCQTCIKIRKALGVGGA